MRTFSLFTASRVAATLVLACAGSQAASGLSPVPLRNSYQSEGVRSSPNSGMRSQATQQDLLYFADGNKVSVLTYPDLKRVATITGFQEITVNAP